MSKVQILRVLRNGDLERRVLRVDTGKEGLSVVSLGGKGGAGARGASHVLRQEDQFRAKWPWWHAKKGPTWLLIEGVRESVPLRPGKGEAQLDEHILWALVNQKVVEDALRAEAFGEKMRLLFIATAILAGAAALFGFLAFDAATEARDLLDTYLKSLPPPSPPGGP